MKGGDEKVDKKKTKRFEAKSKAMVSKLGGLIKAGKLKAMAGLMTGNTSLVLLKSRKVYRGPEAIIGFWKELKAQGLIEFRLSVKKNILAPADALLPEGGARGMYMSYDMANHIFGTCEFVFRTKSTAGGDPDFLALTKHRLDCNPCLDLIVLNY
jgi:hypothetical protein